MRPNPYPGIIIPLFFTIFFNSGMHAQSAVLSSGGDATGTGGSVAYSVGQVAYTHIEGEDGSVSLGVQQPHFVIMVNTDDPDLHISASAYPNPANDLVTLRLDQQSGENIMHDNLSFTLFTVDGTQLLQQDIKSNVTNVSLEKFPGATYVLRITRDNTVIKTFKIFKTN